MLLDLVTILNFSWTASSIFIKIIELKLLKIIFSNNKFWKIDGNWTKEDNEDNRYSCPKACVGELKVRLVFIDGLYRKLPCFLTLKATIPPLESINLELTVEVCSCNHL
jgi:hypothetical protein